MINSRKCFSLLANTLKVVCNLYIAEPLVSDLKQGQSPFLGGRNTAAPSKGQLLTLPDMFTKVCMEPIQSSNLADHQQQQEAPAKSTVDKKYISLSHFPHTGTNPHAFFTIELSCHYFWGRNNVNIKLWRKQNLAGLNSRKISQMWEKNQLFHQVQHALVHECNYNVIMQSLISLPFSLFNYKCLRLVVCFFSQIHIHRTLHVMLYMKLAYFWLVLLKLENTHSLYRFSKSFIKKVTNFFQSVKFPIAWLYIWDRNIFRVIIIVHVFSCNSTWLPSSSLFRYLDR